jgi:hypothetical protein
LRTAQNRHHDTLERFPAPADFLFCRLHP